MFHRNITRIKAVANALEELKEKVVFVGGATISLYPDQPVLETRPTDDVDVIIEILNYKERIELEEKLHAIGFTNDIQSGIVCRYRINGIIVDIMPTNDPSIGFHNKWYPDGFKNAIWHTVDPTCIIQILSAPHFIATKFEAFKGRGKSDGRTSHDFEDIIYVLENRSTIWEEMNSAELELKKYIHSEFTDLLRNPHHAEWIECHTSPGSPPATNHILTEILRFAQPLNGQK